MRPNNRPEGRFEQLWLPLWPLASDNLREGIYRTSREKAIGKRYIEANPDALSILAPSAAAAIHDLLLSLIFHTTSIV